MALDVVKRYGLELGRGIGHYGRKICRYIEGGTETDYDCSRQANDCKIPLQPCMAGINSGTIGCIL